MTTTQGAAAIEVQRGTAPDRRDSWIPTMSMITTRMMELRKRRGLMIALFVVTVGLPTLFLLIRVLLHAADPKSYGPAGGSDIFTGIVAGVMYILGFIVAAALGCTAGSSDLTDGMFRHLVVTGRSRLALYLARIPAGLAIIAAMVGTGFTIVCLICCFSAPTTTSFNGLTLPSGMSQSAFTTWSVHHVDEVVCNYNWEFTVKGPPPINVPCGPNGLQSASSLPPGTAMPTPAQLRAFVLQIAPSNYESYAAIFLTPSIPLMVDSGLWLLLEATIGFIVGLGLGSLLGQRTVGVILMIILEVVLTPLFLTAHIPYMVNLQRAVVGISMAHLEPLALGRIFGAGGGPNVRSMIVPESTVAASCVVVAWLVVWTIAGAWRMVKRDA